MHVEFTKMIEMISFAKKEQRPYTWIPRGREMGWKELRDWTWHIYTMIFCIKQVTIENILYSPGNST